MHESEEVQDLIELFINFCILIGKTGVTGDVFNWTILECSHSSLEQQVDVLCNHLTGLGVVCPPIRISLLMLVDKSFKGFTKSMAELFVIMKRKSPDMI